MNDDPRWIEWLSASEQLLQAPEAELLDAARTAQETREALRRSLEARPAAAPSSGLSARLVDTERALAERLELLRARFAERLAEVRRARAATRGYRPSRPRRPAFVSRCI